MCGRKCQELRTLSSTNENMAKIMNVDTWKTLKDMMCNHILWRWGRWCATGSANFRMGRCWGVGSLWMRYSMRVGSDSGRDGRMARGHRGVARPRPRACCGVREI